MSLGISPGDFLAFITLAKDVIQNSQKACGVHAELTREAKSLYTVLRRLEREILKPDSIFNQGDDHRREELSDLCGGCHKVLRVLFQILEKYNALPDKDKSLKKLSQMVRFGNGEMLDLHDIRIKMSQYTAALNLFLAMLSVGSQGRVESYMISQGGELKEIRTSLNWMVASMQAKATTEGSILTSYSEDDKGFWKGLRRELIGEGFPSSVIGKHKRIIKQYVMEIGSRGVLDEAQNDEEFLSEKDEVKFEKRTSHTELELDTLHGTDVPEYGKTILPRIGDRALPIEDEYHNSIFSNRSKSRDNFLLEDNTSASHALDENMQSTSQEKECRLYTFETSESEGEETSERGSSFEERLSANEDSPKQTAEFQEKLPFRIETSELQNSSFTTILTSEAGEQVLEATISTSITDPHKETAVPTGSGQPAEKDSQLWLIPHPDQFGHSNTTGAWWRMPIGVCTINSDSKSLEPFEGPILICGSVLNVASLCAWILGTAQMFDHLAVSRIPWWITHPENLNLFTCTRSITMLTNVLLEAKSCIARTRVANSYASPGDRKIFEDFLLRGREMFDHLKVYLENATWKMLREKQRRKEEDAGTPEEVAEARWVRRYGQQDKIRIETYWRRHKIENLGKWAGLDFLSGLFVDFLGFPISLGSHGVSGCFTTVPTIPILKEIEHFLLSFENDCKLAVEKTEATARYPHDITFGRTAEGKQKTGQRSAQLADPFKAPASVWREAIVKAMKVPIEWDALTALLRAYGLTDAQIGAKWTSKLVIGLSKEARARHGGTKAGTIIMEPEKTRRHKKAGTKFLGMLGSPSKTTTTTMRTWDPVGFDVPESSKSRASRSRTNRGHGI